MLETLGSIPTILPEQMIGSSSLCISDFFVLFLSIYVSSFILKLFKKVILGFRILFIDDFCKDYSEPGLEQLGSEPYPNCWVPVAEKEQLTIGGVLRVKALGREIVLFRDYEGQAHAVDPYCPHNGGHLGFGEVVRVRGEDCIKCPFHEWSFRAEDGACVDIPYARERNPPRGGSIKKWHCIERREVIFIWFHENGYDPDYYPDLMEDIDDKKFVLQGRGEITMNSDVYSITEGTSDCTHLVPIHKEMARTDFIGKIPWIRSHFIEQIYTNPMWKPGNPPYSYTAHSTSTNFVNVLGLMNIKVDLDNMLIGPLSYVIDLKYSLMGFTMRRELTILIMPIDKNKLKFITRLHGQKNFFSWLLTRILIMSVQLGIMDDTNIWQHMSRRKKPMLQKEERLMVVFRRWYSQFLSEKIVDIDMDQQSVSQKAEHTN